MTVKVKTKNKIPQDQRLTLDAIHLKQIKKFQSLQKSIPQKKKEIVKIEEQIKKIQKDADNKKDDFSLYFELMDQRRLLEINIQNIEKEIAEIESNQLEEDYLLDVGHIMTQYYINRDNHQSLTINTQQQPPQQPQ
jgi:vacuolar-type H+-ATPase subunit I/STV1